MFKDIKHGLAISLTILAYSVAVPASATVSSNGDAHLVFKAVGPAGLSFEGKSQDVKLKEEGANVVVVVKIDALVTGIELRDRHMKEKYLEMGKYPTAKVEVEKAKLHFPTSGAVSGTVDGKLTLHGITHPVRISYKADGDDKRAKVDGSMRINMKDYKIEVPSYLGVTVKPTIDVEVKLGVVNK